MNAAGNDDAIQENADGNNDEVSSSQKLMQQALDEQNVSTNAALGVALKQIQQKKMQCMQIDVGLTADRNTLKPEGQDQQQDRKRKQLDLSLEECQYYDTSLAAAEKEVSTSMITKQPIEFMDDKIKFLQELANTINTFNDFAVDQRRYAPSGNVKAVSNVKQDSLHS